MSEAPDNGAQTSDDTVLIRASGSLGRLTLNRPRAINALDVGMIGKLSTALDSWESDADIELIVLDGAGERGLCAGGDVRTVYDQISAGDANAATAFFRAEYALNARIAEFPKPVIAFADGITMGGGIGLAGHAGIRIVTERSKLAMPETRIGLTTDVGVSSILGRAPGRVGEYLALTGSLMDAADAIYAGFADHFVPAEKLDRLREALETRGPTTPAEVVSLFEEPPAPSILEKARPWIDEAFSADTVAEIVQRLRARSEPEASAAADTLEAVSPTSLAVTLAAVRRARELPGLRAVLEQDYGLVAWFVHTQPDLPEGIRAQLVDKTRDPRWQPASIAELKTDVAASAFSYRPAIPLNIPLAGNARQ